MFSTALDFFLAQKIHSISEKWKKRALLSLSLLGNLGLLFIFKYYILFLPEPDEMAINVFASEHPIKGFIKHAIYYSIPVGISFYTFQTMSYTIDVYFNRINPEKHLGRFAVFVSFFPQLVAGPIERFSHLQPQLKSYVKFNYENMSNAFRLMLYGFFLKMCIADNLSPIADLLFENPENYSSTASLIGVLAFGFQIYADFAGYSLIAQGAALALGIKLIDNFKTPYLAKNIGEFWKRWHISLSTWFRDYLYIPLGGNRVNLYRWGLNIMLVFIVSGFWHGANWSFLIWGGIHGAIFLFERMGEQFVPLRNKDNNLVQIFRVVKTFCLVQITWIFFRSKSTEKSIDILKNIFSAEGIEQISIEPIILILFALFLLFDIILFNKRFDRFIGKKPLALRWITYSILIFCISAFAGHTNHPFIYFQF